jgi:hypothetical protein
MRTSILAMVVVAGSAIAFQATAQQAAPSDLTKEEMQQRDADKAVKTSEPNQGQVSSGQAQDSSGQAQDSSGQTIGSTSSTHNPRPSSSSPTGLNRKDGETGTDTSTHNPPPERR